MPATVRSLLRLEPQSLTLPGVLAELTHWGCDITPEAMEILHLLSGPVVVHEGCHPFDLVAMTTRELLGSVGDWTLDDVFTAGPVAKSFLCPWFAGPLLAARCPEEFVDGCLVMAPALCPDQRVKAFRVFRSGTKRVLGAYWAFSQYPVEDDDVWVLARK